MKRKLEEKESWLGKNHKIKASFCELNEEKIKKLKKPLDSSSAGRMYCYSCGNIHLIDKEVLELFFLILEENKFNESSDYIETSFCYLCDSTTKSAKIKKIP